MKGSSAFLNKVIHWERMVNIIVYNYIIRQNMTNVTNISTTYDSQD